jgi:hypothetical protein
LTLEKVVSQLTIIASTLQVLEQRVSANENSVNVCLQYFIEQRERQPQLATPSHFAVLNHERQQQTAIRDELAHLRSISDTIRGGINQIKRTSEDTSRTYSQPNEGSQLHSHLERDDVDDQGQD